MCGRFANQQESKGAWDEYFETPYPETETFAQSVTVGYNIAPTQSIPIVCSDGWLAARWGMIAPWADEISTKFATFNARSETIAEKATFRGAWKKGQRCIVPAIGYYEWKKEGEAKQPYFVRSENETPLFFGGLYEPSRGDIPASCTIITLPACESLAPLHQRMPLMISSNSINPWILEGTQQTQTPATFFTPVPKAVNNVRNQGSELIQSIN
jgi:putative SOS response-associated peptidase YedK